MMNGVLTRPGAIAFTRIWREAHSIAQDRVIFTTAPLVAWYAMLGYQPPDNPSIEAVLTIRPPGLMCRTAVRAQMNMPVMLTATTAFQSSTVISRDVWRRFMPALLNRTS